MRRRQVADLDQVVVGLGPGPFTGLRVGVVTAQVLGHALGLELRGVCSLDVMAAQFAEQVRGVRGGHRRAAARGVLGALHLGRRTARRAEVSQPGDVPRLAAIGPQLILLRSTECGARSTRDGSGSPCGFGATLPDAGTRRCICAIPTPPSPPRPSRCCTTRVCGDDPLLPRSWGRRPRGPPGPPASIMVLERSGFPAPRAMERAVLARRAAGCERTVLDRPAHHPSGDRDQDTPPLTDLRGSSSSRTAAAGDCTTRSAGLSRGHTLTVRAAPRRRLRNKPTVTLYQRLGSDGSPSTELLRPGRHALILKFSSTGLASSPRTYDGAK